MKDPRSGRSSGVTIGALLVCVAVVGAAACNGHKEEGATLFVRAVADETISSDLAELEIVVAYANGETTSAIAEADGREEWRVDLFELSEGQADVRAIGRGSDGEEVEGVAIEGVVLARGRSATVVFQLVSPPLDDWEHNVAPVIDGVAVSSTTVESGGEVTLSIAASDSDEGDMLELAWETNGGTLDDATGTRPTWTAPSEPGAYTLTGTARDGNDGVSTAVLRLEVGSPTAEDVAVEVAFNTWPQVLEVVATPTVVLVEGEVELVASAYDRDGDDLEFGWSDEGGECAGVFDDIRASDTVWTSPAEAPTTSACVLSLEVGDIQGEATAQVSVDIDPCAEILVTELDSFPTTLVQAVASDSVNGKIYVFGGTASVDWENPLLANVWELDVETEQVLDLGEVLPYPIAMLWPCGVAVGDNGKVYLSPAVGPEFDWGYGNHQCLIEFDPETETAREAACFPEVRWNSCLAPDGEGRIYYFSGWHDIYEDDLDGHAMEDVWIYDPETDELEQLGVSFEMWPFWNTVVDARGVVHILDSIQAVAFDPADEVFSDPVELGLVDVHIAWLDDDGLIHGLGVPEGGSPWGAAIHFDPETGETETIQFDEPLVDVFAQARAYDAVHERLYLFGGEQRTEEASHAVDQVVRIECLP